MIKTVIKRNGNTEPFNPDKLNRWAEWASKECNVPWGVVLVDAMRSLPDTVSTSDIHATLIRQCIEMRDEGHSKMAARLLIGQIRKEVLGDSDKIPTFKEFYTRMVEQGHWEFDVAEEDFPLIEKSIDHTRDFGYAYATVKQFYDKYSIKKHDQCLETPQFAFMGLALSNLNSSDIKEQIAFYNDISTLKVNLPTPTLNGERTPLRGGPSCCVISGGDTADSIHTATSIAYKMTSLRAGIGIELTTRTAKDPVKGGLFEHYGKFHYYSLIDRSVKASSQLTRGGSATVTFTCLDPQIDMLTNLKSQRTKDSQRLEFMDYSLAINETFIRAAMRDEEWMLVSYYHAPELYEALYTADKFERVYNKVIADPNVPKTMVMARDILTQYLRMRAETGRNYITFIDNMNHHTPFVEPIRLSNLCMEISLPTQAFTSHRELYQERSDGEIALCFLASKVMQDETDEEYEEQMYRLVKSIDNIIDKSEYPYESLEYSALKRRSIGVGITNMAHWMASHGYKYNTEEGRNAAHRVAERHSYFLHKASVRLAKERGACEWMHKTKYANDKPWLPIDTYNHNIDEHHSQALVYDWESLREDVRKFGVRFSVLEAFMPVESSSLMTNSTNGLYPIRKHQLFKGSRKGYVFFQAPEWDQISDSYQSAFDVSRPDMIKFYSIIQKFTGQGISADLYQDFTKEASVSMKSMVTEVALAHKLGMKTWYYMVSNDESKYKEDSSKTQVETVDESSDCCTL